MEFARAQGQRAEKYREPRSVCKEPSPTDLAEGGLVEALWRLGGDLEVLEPFKLGRDLHRCECAVDGEIGIDGRGKSSDEDYEVSSAARRRRGRSTETGLAKSRGSMMGKELCCCACKNERCVRRRRGGDQPQTEKARRARSLMRPPTFPTLAPSSSHPRWSTSLTVYPHKLWYIFTRWLLLLPARCVGTCEAPHTSASGLSRTAMSLDPTPMSVLCRHGTSMRDPGPGLSLATDLRSVDRELLSFDERTLPQIPHDRRSKGV